MRNENQALTGKETNEMARQDYLYLLKIGVMYWNQWRQEHPEILLDLSKVTLGGVDLTYINLSKANLTMADLSAANLKLANLKEANLTMANLSAADLRMANLHAANLHAANLREADLREANLSAANLKVADLSLADIRGAILDGAIFDMTILDKTKKRRGWWSFFSWTRTSPPSGSDQRRQCLDPGQTGVALQCAHPTTTRLPPPLHDRCAGPSSVGATVGSPGNLCYTLTSSCIHEGKLPQRLRAMGRVCQRRGGVVTSWS